MTVANDETSADETPPPDEAYADETPLPDEAYSADDEPPPSPSGPDDMMTAFDAEQLATIDRFALDEIDGLSSVPMTALFDGVIAAATRPRVSTGIRELDDAVRLRLGQFVVVTGSPGAGKTSLVLQFLAYHAVTTGPAILVSAELTAEEVAARRVSQTWDVSWGDVLDLQVDEERIRLALDAPGLRVLAEKDASLDRLDAELRTIRAAEPEHAIMVGVDYLQLVMLAAGPKDLAQPGQVVTSAPDLRNRMIFVVERLRRIAQEHNALVVALSQMSRSAAGAARRGEMFGVETLEAGAESAQIERAAHVVMTLGVPQAGTPYPIVPVSIAKARAGSADKVIPLVYHGARGLFWASGPATDPESAREAHSLSKSATRRAVLVDVLRQQSAPVSRNTLLRAAKGRPGCGKRDLMLAAIAEAINADEIVELAESKGGYPLLWLPDLAERRGLKLRD